MSDGRRRSTSVFWRGRRIYVTLPPRPSSSSSGLLNPFSESSLQATCHSTESGKSEISHDRCNGFTNETALSKPSESTSQVPFRFGRSCEDDQASHQPTMFTFRSLHNVTPQPSHENIALSFRSLQIDSSGPPLSSVQHTPQLTSSSDTSTLSSSLVSGIPPTEQEISQSSNTSHLGKDNVGDGAHGLLSSVELNPPPPSDNPTGVSPIAGSQSAPTLVITQPGDSEGPEILESSTENGQYDVRDEVAPPSPFFAPAFQKALQSGMAIAKSLVSAIERVKDTSRLNDNLERLLKDAKKLSTFETSATRTIAVLGDTGHGKSSLINSLLHFPEIARSAGIGRAGTSVVTEYRHKTRRHTAPLTVEVEYFTNLEIHDLIADLIRKYRLILTPEDEVQDMSYEDYTHNQEESQQAWSTLETVFKHDALFSKEYLSDVSEGAAERITEHFQKCAHDIEWPAESIAGNWISTAETADELWDKASSFMNDQLWPFTKIFRVYLSAQVLKTGIVLADLPGLADTNLARVRAAQTYLMKCDHVFVIAEINRAVANRSLKWSVSGILKRNIPLRWKASGGKHLKVAVVCTKSEDLAMNNVRRDLSGSKRLSPSQVQRLVELDRAVAQASAASDSQRREACRLRQKLILMEARNQSVRDDLQEAYCLEIPGTKLEVFCVSNTMYEEYVDLNDVGMIQASGIPEVRKFCHTITAEAQLLEAKHFLQSTLSSLLSSVAMLARNSATISEDDNSDRNFVEEIDKRLEGAEDQIFRAIDRASERFHDSFRENFHVLLGMFTVLQNSELTSPADRVTENLTEAWEDAAIEQSNAWPQRQYHWKSFHAWCAHNGAWETRTVKFEDWNDQIIWKMRSDLAYQWEITEDDISSIFDELLQAIVGGLRTLASFETDSALVFEWSLAIDSRIKGIEYRLRKGRDDVESEVNFIRGRASESNSTSYILNEMLPTYRQAEAQSGTGKKDRQHTILQRRITDGRMFPAISASILEGIDTMNCTKSYELRNKMRSIFDNIKLDLDNMRLRGPLNDEDTREDGGESMQCLWSEVDALKVKHDQVLRSIPI